MTFTNVHEEHKAKDGFYREGDSFIFICIVWDASGLPAGAGQRLVGSLCLVLR